MYIPVYLSIYIYPLCQLLFTFRLSPRNTPKKETKNLHVDTNWCILTNLYRFTYIGFGYYVWWSHIYTCVLVWPWAGKSLLPGHPSLSLFQNSHYFCTIPISIGCSTLFDNCQCLLSLISDWFKTIWFMLFLHDTRCVAICWLLDGKHETDAVCAEGLDQYNIHYFLMLGGTMVAWRHELRAEGREGSGKIW